MLINFDEIEAVDAPNLNNGIGTVKAKILVDYEGKLIVHIIPKNASIGNHTHNTSAELNYVISGKGTAIWNGSEEELTEGICHYCPKKTSHSIVNTGSDDLVLLTIVVEESCSIL